MHRLIEYLKKHTLFADGAMGTYYGEKYQEDGFLVEKANLLFPERIKEIHLEYLKSGARLLRTNTFAINTGFFATREEMKKHIKAGYRLAEDAKDAFLKQCEKAGKKKPEIFIAADIGTIYDLGQRDENRVLQEYKFLIDTFMEAGADIFLLETQADIYYIPALVSYIKEQNKDAFVAVTFSFDKTGYTKTGLRLERMICRMCELNDVDAYGMNCGMEAAHMYQMLKNVTFPSENDLWEKCTLFLPGIAKDLWIRNRCDWWVLWHDTGIFYRTLCRIRKRDKTTKINRGCRRNICESYGI